MIVMILAVKELVEMENVRCEWQDNREQSARLREGLSWLDRGLGDGDWLHS